MTRQAQLGMVQRGRSPILLLGLAALVPLIVFAAFALMTALDAYRDSDELRLRNTSRALAAAVDSQLDTLVTALETLAFSPLLDDPRTFGGFEDRARLVARRLDGQVFLLGPAPHYSVLASTGVRPSGPLPEPLRVAVGPVIEIVLDQGVPAISNLFQGAVDSRPSLTVMVPVDREGQPRRVLGLRFEPSALLALLERQVLPPGTFAAIADSRWRILAHTEDPEGQRLGAAVPAWVAPTMEGRQQTLVNGPGWSGKENIYAIERLTRHPGWTVAVGEPRAVQEASAWNGLRWLLAGSSALAIGLMAVVWSSRREALLDARREADALRAGRAEVERLLAGLPALIFLRAVRPDGSSRPLFRAGALERVTGWPAAEILTLPNLDALIHPSDPSFGRQVQRLLREGHVAYECRIRQPGGGFRILQIAARVLAHDADGGADVVGYTVDVTALREAEARALAATRLAALGELAAGLAHELRQPLATVALAAENALAALDANEAEDVRKRLGRINAQTKRAANLIERLRRFSRGAAKDVPAADVLLDVVIQGGLELTHTALQEAGVEVVVELERSALCVRAQAVLLEQVLSNLLVNARDALAERPPGAARRIRVEAATQYDETVRLTVADTGGGIPPEVMARLFEPFVTTKHPEKGTGLGLSICYALVKEMGGAIAIRNGEAGAIVDIVLPASIPGSPAARDLEGAVG